MSKLNRRTFLKGATCSTVTALTSGLMPSGARVAYGQQAVGGKCVVFVNMDGGTDWNCIAMDAGGTQNDLANALNGVRSVSTRPLGSGLSVFGGSIAMMSQWSNLVANQGTTPFALVDNVGYDGNRRHSRSHAEARRNMEAATPSAAQAGMTMEGIFTQWQRNSSRFPNATNCLDRSAGNTQITNGGALSVETNRIEDYNLGSLQNLEGGGLPGDALIDSTLADSSLDTDTRDAIFRSVQSARDDIAAVQVAAQFAANNFVNFPQNNSLSGQFNDIAASIIFLPTRFAIAKQGGYDTHSNQDADQANGRLPRLITALDEAINAFFTTLANAPGGSRADDVILVLTTEFGRTFRENGSNGTDHAMGSKVLVIGSDVNTGLYGSPDDATDATNRNYMNPTTHIGQVWADVMRWMGDDPNSILDPGVTGTLGILS